MRAKVIDSARELGLRVDVRELAASTRTAAEAADALGCAQGQIAKSLVFIADGDPVLCIASGDRRVSLDRLADVLDAAEVRQASPGEVRASTGFAVGGVSPFGHELPVVLDETLLAHEQVWAAGGDGHTVFAVDPRKLAGCTSATAAAVLEA